MDTEDQYQTLPPPLPYTPNLVLVVDDIEVNRILARAHLEQLGWQVAECESAQQAMDFMCHKTPAAMLVDIHMPHITGDRLVRRIRAILGPDILLVGFTAHHMPGDLEEIRTMGFDELLQKPVPFSEMARLFRKGDRF